MKIIPCIVGLGYVGLPIPKRLKILLKLMVTIFLQRE